MKPVSSNVSEESRGFNSTEGVPQFIISDPSSHVLKTCAEKQPKYLIQKRDAPNPKNHEQPNHSKPYLQPEASGTPAVTRTTKQAQRPQTFHPEFWSFRKLRYLFSGSLSFSIFSILFRGSLRSLDAGPVHRPPGPRVESWIQLRVTFTCSNVRYYFFQLH